MPRPSPGLRLGASSEHWWHAAALRLTESKSILSAPTMLRHARACTRNLSASRSPFNFALADLGAGL